MTINFKLGNKRDVDPQFDPMSRAWVGYEVGMSASDIFGQNRGVWYLGQRAWKEKLVTFSYQGVVVAVAEIDGVENVRSSGAERPKQAVMGRALEPGNPVYDKTIGRAVNSFRNPVTYERDSGSHVVCACGCGAEISSRRAFVAGHDQKAVRERIKAQWGNTLGFVDWFDDAYGPLPVGLP